MATNGYIFLGDRIVKINYVNGYHAIMINASHSLTIQFRKIAEISMANFFLSIWHIKFIKFNCYQFGKNVDFVCRSEEIIHINEYIFVIRMKLRIWNIRSQIKNFENFLFGPYFLQNPGICQFIIVVSEKNQ